MIDPVFLTLLKIAAVYFGLTALWSILKALERLSYWFTMALWYVVRRAGRWYFKPFIRDGPNKEKPGD